MSDFFLFADGAFAVESRGFPPWLPPALAGEWYLSPSAGRSPGGGDGAPALMLRTVAEETRAGATKGHRFSVRFSPGHMVAQRRAIRVDLAAQEVVIDLPAGRAAAEEDAALLALTKVALLRCLAGAGVLALHAAAFQAGDESFLCVGKSNSGKSTLAALALRQGGRIVSDDSVLIWRQADGAVVAPLRRDVHLRWRTATILPHAVQDRGLATPGGRVTLSRLSLPALFTPRIAPSKLILCGIDRRRTSTRVRRITQADALAGVILATSAAYLAREFPALHQATWAVVKHLVATVGSFRVDLGRDVLDRPDEAWAHLQRCLAGERP